MIAFLGGVFDPPHFGHIKPVRELAVCDEVAQVRLLPCRLPSHKQTFADETHRLAMLKMLEQPPGIVIDTYEIQRQDVSYTVDSLSYFRQQAGRQQSLAFVLGQDAFLTITEWSRYQQLLELANLIVTVRSGYRVADDHILLKLSGGWSSLSELAQVPAGKIALFSNHTWDISSSKIRHLIAQGQSLRYLVPGVVWNYIRRKQLYGYHENSQ